jgi:hypothetical protein
MCVKKCLYNMHPTDKLQVEDNTSAEQK